MKWSCYTILLCMVSRGADVNPADQLQMFLREFGVAGAASVHLQDRVNLIFRQGDELRSHKKALLHWEYHLCKVSFGA